MILVSWPGSNDDDVLRGFRVGADDYVAGPFSQRQLAARIRALLNRYAGRDSRDERGAVHAGHAAGPARARGIRNGKTVRLTPLEFRILYVLATRRGAGGALEESLAEYAWGFDGELVAPNLKTHLSNIRQKLELRPDQGPRSGTCPASATR